MAADAKSTSRPIIPRAFKRFPFAGVNVDYGGGKYECATEYLAQLGCTNLVVDPFNRTPEHNSAMLGKAFSSPRVDSVSCLNVLNVLRDEIERAECIEKVKCIAEKAGTITGIFPKVYFQVYDGSAKKVSDLQVKRPLSAYLPEIESQFVGWTVESKYGTIVLQKV